MSITYNDLIARAQQVRDESEIGANTATRVGQLLADIIQWCQDNNADLGEYLLNFTAHLNERGGILNWFQSRIVLLKTMGSAYDDVSVGSLSDGDVYYDSQGNWIYEKSDSAAINGIHPSKGVFYVNLANKTAYQWDGTTFQVAIESGGGGGASTVTAFEGYEVVASVGDLPEQGDPATGYIVGTHIYIYVGENGDTADGKYQDLGELSVDPDIYQPRLLAGTGIAIAQDGKTVSVNMASGVVPNSDLPVSAADVYDALDGITAGKTVVINSDGANIIDDYSDSVLVATSARLVKELYLNLQQLRSDLANMAFTNGKPSWITVAKRQYDLSLASSGNDGLSEVYIVNGDTDGTELTTTATKVNEGAVKLRLVPTASNLAFTHIIVNGVDIAQTAVDAGKSDGSVYVTFILNADATISAIAASGVTVSMGSSTNCSMNIASQAVDENFSRQITASNHYTLPSTITVMLNGTTALASGTDYTYTRANDNKTATLEIDKSKFANASSIEVTCQADPVASCTVTWSQVDMIVKHGNDVLFDNGNLATPSVTVYADDLNYALTFEAATGKKFTTVPNINGTNLAGSNGVYTLTVDSVSDITVVAVVGVAETFSVSLQDSMHGTQESPEGNIKLFTDSGLETELQSRSVQEGGALSCYLGVVAAASGYINRLVWDTSNGENYDYPIKVTMDDNGTEEDITDNCLTQAGTLLHIDIQNVTGDITIYARSLNYRLNMATRTNESSITSNNAADMPELIPIAQDNSAGIVLYGVGALGFATLFYNENRTFTNYRSHADDNNYNGEMRTIPRAELDGDDFCVPTLNKSHINQACLFTVGSDGKILSSIYRGLLCDNRYHKFGLHFGKYLSDVGTDNTSQGCAYTDYIDISEKGYESITFKTNDSTSTARNFAGTAKVFACNSSGAVLTNGEFKPNNNSVEPKTATLPAGTAKLRISMRGAHTAYVYGTKTVNGVSVSEWIFRGVDVADSTLPEPTSVS